MHVQYFYTWINKNQMQRQWFNNMSGSRYISTVLQLPARWENRHADVAQGGNEFDNSGLNHGPKKQDLTKVPRCLELAAPAMNGWKQRYACKKIQSQAKKTLAERAGKERQVAGRDVNVNDYLDS